jgi:hypothetical protein
MQGLRRPDAPPLSADEPLKEESQSILIGNLLDKWSRRAHNASETSQNRSHAFSDQRRLLTNAVRKKAPLRTSVVFADKPKLLDQSREILGKSIVESLVCVSINVNVQSSAILAAIVSTNRSNRGCLIDWYAAFH